MHCFLMFPKEYISPTPNPTQPNPTQPNPARQGQGGGDDQSLLLQPGADGVGGGRGAVHHKLPSQQLFRRSHEASV